MPIALLAWSMSVRVASKAPRILEAASRKVIAK
jgi:hypothetical protein